MVEWLLFPNQDVLEAAAGALDGTRHNVPGVKGAAEDGNGEEPTDAKGTANEDGELEADERVLRLVRRLCG